MQRETKRKFRLTLVCYVLFVSVKHQVAGLNTVSWLHIDNPQLKNTPSATSINMNILYIDDMIKKSFDVNDEFKGLIIALSGKNKFAIRSNM